MTRPSAIVLALLVALAGCAAPESDTPLVEQPLSDPAPPTQPPQLAVAPPEATQGATTTITGTLDRAARITILGVWHGAQQVGAPPLDAPAGAWSVQVGLDYGRTNLTVIADDGHATTEVHVVAVRLASATFEARFTAAVPPHDPISDLVWYDPDELASASLYPGTAATHPPTANVHDLMVTWERQAGKTITYSEPAAFGFGVNAIDGVGQPLDSSAPPYWCYKLNGATADLGISAQPLVPGDVVAWEYAGCA